MLLNVLLIIAGFYLLIKGSDYLIKGSASLAKKFGISSMVIGLTVVALGTSTPELFVNIVASLHGATDIVVGNILGSNLANILFVLGIAAILRPVVLQSNTVRKEIPLSLIGVVMVLLMGSDMLLNNVTRNMISRTDGIVLLLFLVLFIVYTFRIRRDTDISNEIQIDQINPTLSVLNVIGGLIALAVGGKFVVEGATVIAQAIGISQHVIALTVVALGTSLPELVSSVVAIRKGHMDLAVGNLIGSNILNIFFILATSAIIHPLTFTTAYFTDAFVVFAVTFLLLLKLLFTKRHVIGRTTGVLFVVLYLAIIVFAVARG